MGWEVAYKYLLGHFSALTSMMVKTVLRRVRWACYDYDYLGNEFLYGIFAD